MKPTSIIFSSKSHLFLYKMPVPLITVAIGNPVRTSHAKKRLLRPVGYGVVHNSGFGDCLRRHSTFLQPEPKVGVPRSPCTTVTQIYSFICVRKRGGGAIRQNESELSSAAVWTRTQAPILRRAHHSPRLHLF